MAIWIWQFEAHLTWNLQIILQANDPWRLRYPNCGYCRYFQVSSSPEPSLKLPPGDAFVGGWVLRLCQGCPGFFRDENLPVDFWDPMKSHTIFDHDDVCEKMPTNQWGMVCWMLFIRSFSFCSVGDFVSWFFILTLGRLGDQVSHCWIGNQTSWVASLALLWRPKTTTGASFPAIAAKTPQQPWELHFPLVSRAW